MSSEDVAAIVDYKTLSPNTRGLRIICLFDFYVVLLGD